GKNSSWRGKATVETNVSSSGNDIEILRLASVRRQIACRTRLGAIRDARPQPVFHSGTLFQNETPRRRRLPGDAFHREPRGSELKPARAAFPCKCRAFLRICVWHSRCSLSASEGGRGMGWLDAHESYVMETIARDRLNELRSASGEVRLLDGLRRGDPAATNELVERYAARGYRVAHAIMRDAADAEKV